MIKDGDKICLITSEDTQKVKLFYLIQLVFLSGTDALETSHYVVCASARLSAGAALIIGEVTRQVVYLGTQRRRLCN